MTQSYTIFTPRGSSLLLFASLLLSFSKSYRDYSRDITDLANAFINEQRLTPRDQDARLRRRPSLLAQRIDL